MNKILQAGAFGVMTLGFASAHGSIVASKSSSTPGDLLLFAEVVSGGTAVGYYVGDTSVSVGGLNPASKLSNGSLIQTGGDANLASLLSLAQVSGNTLEWAVQGGGYDSAENGSVLTTVTNATDLNQLKLRPNASVGYMINGIDGAINNTLNTLVSGNGTSYEGTATTKWDVTNTNTTSNLEDWYGNGTFTAQTGFGSATLYGVVAPAAGGYSVTTVGTVTLSSSGLQFDSAGEAPDTYNLSTHQLTIPTLGIGSATFSDVVLTVGDIITSPSGTAPNGSEDTYDPESKDLTVQTVQVGSGTYYNVVVSVSALVSIGSATGTDTYAGGQLVIPSVQVGSSTYTDVICTVAGIVGLANGMPQNALDVYEPSTGDLLIAAVTYQGKVYTNVTIKVGKVLQVNGNPYPGAADTGLAANGGLRFDDPNHERNN